MEQIIESHLAHLDSASAGSLAPSSKSAASWPAIIAGAFVAASVSLLLLALGSGLGLAAVSPWPNRGVSVTTFAVTTAIWLIVMQWVSAGFGGYIAGRLRTRWIGTHAHEVFFRDTAHGFVTWAVATVLVATVFAASLSSSIGGGMHALSDVASGAARDAVSSPGTAYGLDKLFRSTGSAVNLQSTGNLQSPVNLQNADDPLNLQNADDPRLEAGHILANAMISGSVADADRTYLANLVIARTGASPADAQKRVEDFIAGATEAEMKVKAAADAARKAAMQASVYAALSMLVGAFIASVAAALGGRLRDEQL